MRILGRERRGGSMSIDRRLIGRRLAVEHPRIYKRVREEVKKEFDEYVDQLTKYLSWYPKLRSVRRAEYITGYTYTALHKQYPKLWAEAKALLEHS